MKFSIIMPTYNDCVTIEESLLSIVNQNYDNWELIIVDDGSTDNTKKVVANFIKSKNLSNKISYIYQENKDQLNAIKKSIEYISGDYVYILHSDDLLNEGVLKKANFFLKKHKKVDAIISDLTIINELGKITGISITSNYINKKWIIPKQLLWIGRNLYCDVAFFNKNIFINQVFINYLTWNGPFWLNIDDNNILNVKKVNFSFLKYRVYEGNYINNYLGKLCVINGEIRVITSLMSKYHIPCFKLQYYLYRAINKIKLGNLFVPIYSQKETKNKYKLLLFSIKKRFNQKEINDNLYLTSLLNFFKYYKKRKIYVNKINTEVEIFQGSDLRVFNKKILNNELNELYYKILNEMSISFDEIVVFDKEDEEKVKTICRFLSINSYVKINIKQGSNQ